MGAAVLNLIESVRAVIYGRRSVRREYLPDEIAPEILRDLVRDAMQAPSGSNSQCLRFVIETGQTRIAYLAQARPGFPGMANAAALILVLADRTRFRQTAPGLRELWRPLAYQDAAAAIQNMLLSATALRLASCWVSAFPEMEGTPALRGGTWQQVLSRYALGENLEPMGIVALARVLPAAMAGDETHRGRPVRRGSTDSAILFFGERAP